MGGRPTPRQLLELLGQLPAEIAAMDVHIHSLTAELEQQRHMISALEGQLCEQGRELDATRQFLAAEQKHTAELEAAHGPLHAFP